MKQLLINASFPDETRVALLDNSKLKNLEFERHDNSEQQGNIYKGQITNIASSIDAAFIDFGAERNGFLPIRNISDELKGGKSDEIKISDILQLGDQIIVQVQVERGQHEKKGALLSTIINLAGRYLTLHPDSPQLKRIGRGRRAQQDTQALQKKLLELTLPEKIGLTLHAESLHVQQEDLEQEIKMLHSLWEQIKEKSENIQPPALLLREPKGLFRILRDYLNSEVQEVLIDTPQTFKMAKEWALRNKPEHEHKIILYEELTPLFVHYKIEAKVESVHHRRVPLPSGGSLIFDHTAAMSTIDINSGRIQSGNMEDTALKTNREAAVEIAQQLRFRDIGGQIVIDFIDMEEEENNREIERVFQRAMDSDNAHPNIGTISEFGLLCMTRKRLRSSVDDTFMRICSTCEGQGKIRTARSLAMSMLRNIEFEASKPQVRDIHVLTPAEEELAAVLFNEQRKNLLAIEAEYQVNIAVIPSAQLRFPNYKIKSHQEKKTPQQQDNVQQGKQAAQQELQMYHQNIQKARQNNPEALVTNPYQISGSPEKKPGVLKSLWDSLFSKKPKTEPKPPPQRRRRRRNPSRSQTSQRQRRNRRPMSGGGQQQSDTRRRSASHRSTQSNEAQRSRGRAGEK